MFCERFLERPRHVEAQVLADAHGHVHALGLRDCSVQRRHQKIVEESPPPALSPGLAARIEQAAVDFCTAIGYRGAGTAEFLVDGDDLYFLELNGRIQVEHPVTEEALGIDLVELQLAAAAGAPIAEVPRSRRAHAIEARLYAEDPRTFLPQAGRITRLRLPASVRVDAGVEEGDEIGTAYDPMIAKLIARGDSRDEALDRLAAALAATEVDGLTTNLPFLRWLVAHPAFRAGRLSTAFLADFPPLTKAPRRLPEGPFRGSWRLNLPAPVPGALPDVDVAAHAHDRHAGETHRQRPHARDRAPRRRRRGRHGRGTTAAPRARGDEDGDAGDGAVRRNRHGRPRPCGRPRGGRGGARRTGALSARRAPVGARPAPATRPPRHGWPSGACRASR